LTDVGGDIESVKTDINQLGTSSDDGERRRTILPSHLKRLVTSNGDVSTAIFDKTSNSMFQSPKATANTTSNGRSNEKNSSQTHGIRSHSPYSYFRGARQSIDTSSNMKSRDRKHIDHKHSHTIDGADSSFDSKMKSPFDRYEENDLVTGPRASSRKNRSKSDLIPSLRGSSHFTFSGTYSHGGVTTDSSNTNEKEVDSPRSSEISIGVDMHSAYSGGKLMSPSSLTSTVAQIYGHGQNRGSKPSKLRFEMDPKYNAQTNIKNNLHNHNTVGPSSRVMHNLNDQLGNKSLRLSSKLENRRIKPKIRRIKSSDVHVSSEDEVDSAGADVDSDDFLDDESIREDEEIRSRDENDKDKMLVTAGVTSPFLRLAYVGRPLNPFPAKFNSQKSLKIYSKTKDELTPRESSIKSETASKSPSARPRSSSIPTEMAESSNSFIPASVSKTFNAFFPSILS